jgi:Arc/MetJ-type ribon-helix-helix transcriptional regulator
MKNKEYPLPLTFDLTREQSRKIKSVRRSRGLRSASDVVRTAIAELAAVSVPSKAPRFRQISVRLSRRVRENLRRQAKRKNRSIGDLVRVALEAIQPRAK